MLKHELRSECRMILGVFQGGPGASSAGYGNFELIGPLDSNFNERSTTWVSILTLQGQLTHACGLE